MQISCNFWDLKLPSQIFKLQRGIENEEIQVDWTPNFMIFMAALNSKNTEI